MNSRIFSYLRIAAQIAQKGPPRAFLLGAVGVRSDGTLVASFNGSAIHPLAKAHAEARLARKLDRGAEVYVARLLRNGSFALARPCAGCIRELRKREVRRVWYSIAEGEFGCLKLS